MLLIDCDWGLRCLDLILGVSGEMVFDLGDILNSDCEISKAIYSVDSVEGLFLIPAPTFTDADSAGDNLKRLCRALYNNFDYIFIDSPAGIENGFRVAVSPAQLALVVVTPDPVCIRDAERVGEMLKEYGVREHRLVINKLKKSVFRFDGTADLDKVIDGVSMQLIGIIPEDKNVQHSAVRGIPLQKGRACAAINRIAARIEGEDVLIPRSL